MGPKPAGPGSASSTMARDLSSGLRQRLRRHIGEPPRDKDVNAVRAKSHEPPAARQDESTILTRRPKSRSVALEWPRRRGLELTPESCAAQAVLSGTSHLSVSKRGPARALDDICPTPSASGASIPFGIHFESGLCATSTLPHHPGCPDVDCTLAGVRQCRSARLRCIVQHFEPTMLPLKMARLAPRRRPGAAPSLR